MNLNKEQMHEMNLVQLNIFKAFLKLCEELNLTYYMIHGSLLGTIRYSGFFPMDDDIDVAMPRKDYEIFIKEGQNHLPGHLFIQSCETEMNYPLAFAKIRDSSTTFMQTVTKRLNINQGIYIDVFPMDFFPNNKLSRLSLSFFSQLYKARISLRIKYAEKQPLWKKAIRILSVLVCPSWSRAVHKRANLYKRYIENNLIVIVGAKKKDCGIPLEWFSYGELRRFEGLEVNCPLHSDKYLNNIYGDYSSYDPSKPYMNPDGTITVGAERFSTTKSYRNLNE